MIKLCGMRRNEDIAYCNECMPDYIGFIFAESKRRVSSELAGQLRSELDPKIVTVGVTVNAHIEFFTEISGSADIFQLHGNEDAEYISSLRKLFPEKEIWKAGRIRSETDIDTLTELPADKFVLDAFSAEAYGGTGKKIDEKLLAYAKNKLSKPFFIAGGIDSSNIADIIKKFTPYGVDLSSGIETDGFKDGVKMLEIMKIYHNLTEDK